MKSLLLLKQSRIRSFLLESTGFLSIQIRYKSGGGRPKKKIYQRVYDLDRVMELQKKPSLILELKAIIQRQKHHSLLIRDLEKEVGFVKKWTFMSVIEKYPAIFRVDGGNRAPISVRLTEKAEKVASEEVHAVELMEPILVKNLRKLLMMSMDCRIPLEKIECIESEFGLPRDFKESLIPKYPEFFSVKDINGKSYLNLESWDSSLAITSREEKLDIVAVHDGSSDFSGSQKGAKVSRDGSFSGPNAFRMNFPAGFRPNTKYLEEVQKWQKMPFPSPYLNARRFEPADPKARKRAVAVLHELLSLTMEKRMSSAQLDAFHAEYQLPCKLLLCLVKNHAIFYITNKGARSTVFLKEAYDGSNLIDKCPLLRFYDKFIALSGRRDPKLSNEIPA
ncbi:protein WHAT'S THIS FACTOR 1 homolog, chloroplastic [Macadamia integrifolia]|uniref:protein WHAT'S THIS FACTOR 1 homolog, chloroplastic n=1 Tax=Macadamia integrifolia TaxID=60698 RepID=UPI001C52E55C|nr:protein WHAT'S THIS FACTOR 1 homolog, chloroplastic [Macadamia integrifolia]